jgi:hypothetical protein
VGHHLDNHQAKTQGGSEGAAHPLHKQHDNSKSKLSAQRIQISHTHTQLACEEFCFLTRS